MSVIEQICNPSAEIREGNLVRFKHGNEWLYGEIVCCLPLGYQIDVSHRRPAYDGTWTVPAEKTEKVDDYG